VKNHWQDRIASLILVPGVYERIRVTWTKNRLSGEVVPEPAVPVASVREGDHTDK
jgi:hypothetical protein